MRDKIQQMNYTTWFQPDVDIVRPDTKWPNSTLSDFEDFKVSSPDIIQYGDMLHCDFGVTAMGMNTDTQHLAYVLPPSDTEVPQGLLDGLKKGNRMQDILKTHMKVGKSGNDILKDCLEVMADEGIEGRIYSHPIGDWGHSAGTLVGT
jgi:hypothetical protein